MIIKGDKIKLTKKIGNLVQIGDEFTVTSVENGAITFSSKYGEGVMSYDEFEKHFEKVEEDLKPNKKHRWTEWEEYNLDFYNYIIDEYEDLTLEYRTDNYKRVQMRLKDNTSIRTRTSCYKEDIFNIDKGFQIAKARLYVKWMNEKVNEFTKSM